MHTNLYTCTHTQTARGRRLNCARAGKGSEEKQLQESLAQRVQMLLLHRVTHTHTHPHTHTHTHTHTDTYTYTYTHTHTHTHTHMHAHTHTETYAHTDHIN